LRCTAIDIQDGYKKVIRSGHIVEVYTYDRKPVNIQEIMKEDMLRLELQLYYALSNNNKMLAESYASEYVSKYGIRYCDFLKEVGLDFKPDRKKERLSQTIRDARNTCRRLAIMNFNRNSSFVTLTVAENSDDIDFYDKKFKAFIRKLRNCYGKFHYLAVREFQKRGAIHYHVLIDYPFIKGFSESQIRKEEIDFAELFWKQGFVDIKDISHVDNVGAYVVKYMTIDLHDSRLVGRKSYLTSKGLKRPEIVTGDLELEILRDIEQKKEVFKNSYESEYQGTVKYREFNLER